MVVCRAKCSGVCALLLSAAALLCAAPASADAKDDAFVAALRNYGIVVDDPDIALARAHGVCGGLDRGQDSGLLAVKLMNDPKLDLSSKQAGFFIGASVAAYCAQYKGTLDPSMTWLQPFPPLM